MADDRATTEAILENVALGYMEAAGVDENGDILWRITEAGEARVRSLVGVDQPDTPGETT